jgi:hypothetical protein|tara:strand:- start:18 stop:617 length:600 start_codon:yes stop_codon:yes gene_type:complete
LRNPYKAFLLSLLICCSSTSTTSEYEIEVFESYIDTDVLSSIDTKLIFNIEESNDQINLQVQSFPKSFEQIQSYSLVFDLKFRENYETDIQSLCVGPVWDKFGPGEVSIELKKNNNFKNSVSGVINPENNDGCNNYYYYLRFLTINLEDGEKIFVGVATDYAQNYPDAPYLWLVNKNNQIQELGATKIEKYSLTFELSK